MKTFNYIVAFTSLALLFSCAIFQGATLQERVANGCANAQYINLLNDLRLCGITDRSTLEREVTQACSGQYAIILRELELCN